VHFSNNLLKKGSSFLVKDIKDKVVLITGAARGQGAAHARLFAEHGANLVLSDLAEPIKELPYSTGSLAELTDLSKELAGKGTRVEVCACDVRNRQQVKQMVDRAVRCYGRVDVLINNAGVCTINSFAEVTEEEWQLMLDVNLTGTWRCGQEVTPIMIKQQFGRIINISSVAGLKGISHLSHYVAAKHGVIGLTKAMAIELAPHKITVNCICPGSVHTPLLQGLAVSIGRGKDDLEEFTSKHLINGLVKPEQISSLCLYLAGDGACHITGVALPVDGGWLQN
jgi:NAD(P)-dependent dehydrogenase (short-subunit alcohol dehydrogenase family)